ncbi:MAG: hypothetical protein JXQ65_07740 [Candidatus Marinimicrobia bacterium]|nr:hypothetical protein [Candidatus Neomarinimicrobiota bacterium]
MDHIDTHSNTTEFIHSMRFVSRDRDKDREKENKKRKMKKATEKMKNRKLVHDLTENKGGNIDVLID